MFAVIDRFEGKYGVVELPDGKMMNIDKDRIPSEAKEGDVLVIEDDTIRIDAQETKRRKDEIEKLMEDMWKE